LPRCKISAFLSNHLPNHKRRILLLDAPRHEVIQAFYAADLYLMASKVECAPLVLVEAMASNTPFVSIDVGNAAELVSEFECGIITQTNRDERGYSYGEVNSFVSIVSDLLKGSEHLRAMGERGHQAWKKGLTWDKIVERYEQVFQMIVK
jgi:glycosyltransferase involved in cell wall biosynthesis